MFRIKTILSVIFMLCLISGISLGQDDKSHVKSNDNDSTGNDFEMIFNRDSLFKSHQPTVEIMYGMANPTYRAVSGQTMFGNVTTGEIRLGFSKTKENLSKTNMNPNIIDYEFNFLFLGKNTSDWNSKKNEANRMNTDAWRFGLGSYDGYGYKLGSASDIVLYHGGSLVWTKVDFKDSVIAKGETGAKDQNAVDVFGDAFRFGQRYEGGIKVKVFAPFSINVGFERAVVFPRHMFWYWCGSELLFGIGEGMVSYFSGEILKASPYIGPIASFILKNAYSYGTYELRKKYMNWPIKTASPFMYDNYKLGLSFAF